MQMPDKQKKQLITLSLAGAVLLAGIVAGLLVVQNQQIIKNRAADVAPSCSTPKGTCTVPATGADGYTPFIINVKEIAPDGSSKTIATSPQNAVDPNDPSKTVPVVFDANPLMKYVCEVAPVSITKDCQPVSAEMTAPICQPPANPGNPDSPKTPPTDTPKPGNPDIIPGDPGTPPKACACAADGGTLDCSTRYEGYEGPAPGQNGLIIINPKYNKGPGMCFKCTKLVVNDGVDDKQEYDCLDPIPTGGSLLPSPTGIRLHVAKGSECRNYTIKVVGEKINASAAEPTGAICGNCSGQICCPKCADPVALTECGSFVDRSGKTVQCDFTVNPMCGSVGSEFSVVPQNNTNYSIDFDDPYKTSSGTKHTYANAGVYDIAMSCNNDPSSGPEHVCTKRITIGCGATTVTPPTTTTTTTTSCPKITFVEPLDMCIRVTQTP